MINLPGGYAMDADDCCYIIGKPYTNPKNGNITLAKKSYHNRLGPACESVVERCARDAVASGEITELSKLIDYIAQVKCDISRLVEGDPFLKPTQDLSRGVHWRDR